MPRKAWMLLLTLVAVALAAYFLYPQRRSYVPADWLSTPPATSFLIQFGVGDTNSAVWDGKITANGGWIFKIEGWRFESKDTTDGSSTWKLSTRLGQTGGALVENGIIVSGTFYPTTTFAVETAQGSFSFAAQDIAYGSAGTYVGKRVLVQQVPGTTQLTSSLEDQDFPAIAQRGDDVWASYVEFVHGDRSQRVGSFAKEPANFDFLARTAGGDQVFLLHFSKTRRFWSAPIPVSAPGQDVMRTAVAADGQGRVWVFWSARNHENFDIYAKYLAQSKWSEELRLTSDAGTDVNPVAVTDAQGRVWVAWQGFRNGNLEILTAFEQGDSFSTEAVVSFSPAGDWDPAIAASAAGDVAISWDTYDKGDYDVYFRRLRADNGLRMDPPVPVAASPNFEARSTIAFDSDGRLWIAYESADVKWGKDFGAYEKTGIALYQGQTVKLKCFQGSTPFVTTAAPSFPGNYNSFPRLAGDPDGKVYLAFRSTVAGRAPAGSIWIEKVDYFDGTKWTGPLVFPHTEGILDNRPALLAIAPGDLLLLTAMDHRLSQTKPGTVVNEDWINNDLYSALLEVKRNQAAPPRLNMIAAETVAPPTAETAAELDQVGLMRNYRTTLGAQSVQLLRGEFHRHTEISGDGGRDGPLIDAYRYLIDAASMDWGGCCDHDNGGGLEYNWWLEQKLTDAYRLGRNYIPMFAYERSVAYPEGHRNVVFPGRGVRPLPRLPKTGPDSPPDPAPDTQMLYRYLKRFGGISASHTSATDMGTDWRDNDPLLEPIVEIYQGDRQNYEMPGAPRAPTADNSIGGWQPLGFVSLALLKGYRLGFQASSDHISTHISYCNVWVTEPTREGIMEALTKRRVYGATDNILAEVRCGTHFMGEEFEVQDPPTIAVKLWGAKEFAKVYIIKDNEYVYSVEPMNRGVDLTWRDVAAVKGRSSYYYVRGEQTDGELVWISPMWITYR
jgi:hypothetical protein